MGQRFRRFSTLRTSETFSWQWRKWGFQVSKPLISSRSAFYLSLNLALVFDSHATRCSGRQICESGELRFGAQILQPVETSRRERLMEARLEHEAAFLWQTLHAQEF